MAQHISAGYLVNLWRYMEQNDPLPWWNLRLPLVKLQATIRVCHIHPKYSELQRTTNGFSQS